MALLLPSMVFVHTPKTGGQWLAAALDRAAGVTGRLGPVHASPDELADTEEWASRPHRMAFVRHPLSWYASMWAHRMDESWAPIDDPAWFSDEWVARWAGFTDTTRDQTFDGFLRRVVAHYPDGWVTELFRAYTAQCTTVGRQETLVPDVMAALTAAGEPHDAATLASTPERNTRGSTPDRRRQHRLDPGLASEVMAVESWVADTFSYSGLPGWAVRQWTG